MKQTAKKGEKNQIGAFGEEIVCKYLKNKGFTILTQNYLKKWGEIDLVARETSTNLQKVHFVEVKTVSYETKSDLEQAVSRGTWRPEENVHQKKLQSMHRTIESWIQENEYKGEWQVDVVAVRIVVSDKYACVKYIANIIL